MILLFFVFLMVSVDRECFTELPYFRLRDNPVHYHVRSDTFGLVMKYGALDLHHCVAEILSGTTVPGKQHFEATGFALPHFIRFHIVHLIEKYCFRFSCIVL